MHKKAAMVSLRPLVFLCLEYLLELTLDMMVSLC